MAGKDVIFNRSMTIEELTDVIDRGKRLLCPICGADVDVALDEESAAKLKVHYGVYCSKDHDHLGIMMDFNVEPEFWQQFEE